MAMRIPVQNQKTAAGQAGTPDSPLDAAPSPAFGEDESSSSGGAAAMNDPGAMETSGGEDVPQEIAELRRQLEEKDVALRAMEAKERESADQLLRARADMENVRRRGRQEREEAAQFGTQELLRDLLPALDNLERALSTENVTLDSLREGVGLTLKQFLNAMRKHGVEPLDSAGQPFDANLHDAIMRAEPTAEHPAGTVVEEIQKGYTLRGRLLRPSLVRVAQEG